MIKTQGISFPRSGHGALYHVLRRYFRSELVYCDPEVPRGHADNTGSLCGCGSVPCENPDNTYAKNHDFGLLGGGAGLPVRSDWRYLIQFRSPVRAIVSNFRLRLRSMPQDDTLERWQAFAHQQIAYWNAFMDKWVLRRGDGTYLDVPYERLIQHSEDACRKVLGFVAAEPGDEARLHDALAFGNLASRDRFADFPYFDQGFFEHLESMAGSRLKQARLPSFGDGV